MASPFTPPFTTQWGLQPQYQLLGTVPTKTDTYPSAHGLQVRQSQGHTYLQKSTGSPLVTVQSEQLEQSPGLQVFAEHCPGPGQPLQKRWEAEVR
jgi:hypothetical protein